MSILYIQRVDGEWVDVTDGQLLTCCDCGLVHDTDYIVLDGRILKRAFRDRRGTAYCRMRKDVKMSIRNLKKRKMMDKKIKVKQIKELLNRIEESLGHYSKIGGVAPPFIKTDDVAIRDCLVRIKGKLCIK